MSVITQILNGTNLNRDAGFSSLVSSYIKEGVRSSFGNDLVITTNQCDTGMAFIECTRTSVTPNEIFLVPVLVDVAETIDTSGDGYIIIELDQAKINDGSANSLDGTGIATVKKVSSLPSANFLELASLASGVITDTRESLYIDISKMIADNVEVDTISEKTTDNGVLIDEILSKDGYFDTPEQASNPSTPSTGRWRLFFKADGLYQIDDAGTATKFLSGASAPSRTVTLGEAVDAGDCLRIKGDSLAYKTTDIQDFLPDSLITTRFPSMYWLKRVVYISANKFLFCYGDSGGGTTTTYLKIGTVDTNGKWTFGSAVSWANASFNCNLASYPDQIAVNPAGDRMVAMAQSNSNGVYIKTFTISGTTITAQDGTGASGYKIYNSAGNFAGNNAVSYIQDSGTDYFIFTCTPYSGVNYSLRVGCGQHGSEVITTTYLVDSNALSDAYRVQAVYNQEQEVLITWFENSNSTLQARTVTQAINTKTLTLNSLVTLNTGSGNFSSSDPLRVLQESTDNFIVLWGQYNASGENEVLVSKLLITGTTPALTGSIEIIWTSPVYNDQKYTLLSTSTVQADIYRIGTNRYGLIIDSCEYSNDSPSPNDFIKKAIWGEIDISDTDPLTKLESFKMYLGGNYRVGFTWYSASPEIPIIIGSDSGQIYDDTYVYPFGIKIDTNDFIGWAGSSGSSSSDITCEQDRSTSQSGLVEGKVYRLNDSGGLEVNGSGKVVGRAVSATEIHRIYNPTGQ